MNISTRLTIMRVLLLSLVSLNMRDRCYAFVPIAQQQRPSRKRTDPAYVRRHGYRRSLLLEAAAANADKERNDGNDESALPSNNNPYADPSYPDLEFINYDDPNYHANQGASDEYYSSSDTEQEIEAMRQDQKRRNDEYQFQTYFKAILKDGAEYKGEWTIYKTSTFLHDIIHDANALGMPTLVRAEKPLKVLSRAKKIILDTNSKSLYPVDNERILHMEDHVTDEEFAAINSSSQDKPTITTTNDFGGNNSQQQQLSLSPDEVIANNEKEIMTNTYWPEQISALDFQGQQGIMCVGNAYTISTAVPACASTNCADNTPLLGPFSEYRAEIGIQYENKRFRVKFDYGVLLQQQNSIQTTTTSSEEPPAPPLLLKSMTVCRETLGDWPRDGRAPATINDLEASEALFGIPGAQGGLYDPPPVGSEAQASKYMMVDLDGRATALFPYRMDQDDNDEGWVMTLDWTPGTFRYQVDRKIKGGPQLLCLRTLELSEVMNENADLYRPRDGGADMLQ